MKNKNPFDLSSDMLRNLGEELNKLLTSSQAGIMFMIISAKQLIDTDLAFWVLWSVCLIALLLWSF